MPKSRLLLFVGAALVLVASVGAGAYVSRRTSDEKKQQLLKILKDFFPKNNNYTVRESTGSGKPIGFEQFVDMGKTKEIKAFVIGGIDLARADKALVEKMAASSSGVLEFHKGTRTATVLYAIIKTISGEAVTVAQGDKDLVISMVGQLTILLNDNGRLGYFYYGDKSATQALEGYPYQTSGSPVVFFGITKTFNNWRAGGMILYH